MKRFYIFTTLCVLLSSISLSAQNNIGSIEGGLFVGLNYATDKCGYASVKPGPGFGLEMRYNFYGSPIDLGIQYSFSRTNREYKSDLTYGDNTGGTNSSNLLVVGDYNFRMNKSSFFIGLGAGLAKFSNASPAENFYKDNKLISRDFVGNNKYSVCILPRIGIKLFNHLRFSIDYKIEEKASSNVAFNVGFTIGGK